MSCFFALVASYILSDTKISKFDRRKKVEKQPMGNSNVEVTPFKYVSSNLIVSTPTLKIAKVVIYPGFFNREKRKVLHFIMAYTFYSLYYKL